MSFDRTRNCNFLNKTEESKHHNIYLFVLLSISISLGYNDGNRNDATQHRETTSANNENGYHSVAQCTIFHGSVKQPKCRIAFENYVSWDLSRNSFFLSYLIHLSIYSSSEMMGLWNITHLIRLSLLIMRRNDEMPHTTARTDTFGARERNFPCPNNGK